MPYFNYYSHIAQSGWDRRSFIKHWWRIYAGDPRWVPPYYHQLRWELDPKTSSHLARMEPLLVYTEALPRRAPASGKGNGDPWRGLGAISPFEEPVAATVALQDPRRRDGAAYLALLHCANDAESLERLLARLAELLHSRRSRRVIAPTGLSPHLGTGLLQDCWHVPPPFQTPYDPPYLPELMNCCFNAAGRSRLYALDLAPEAPPVPPGPAELLPLEPARLSGELRPLLAAACAGTTFPTPDADEAEFLLRWLGLWPLYGWIAQVDGHPAGFVLLQPDLAPRLRRAEGGWDPLWQLWLRWARWRPTTQGRLLFGAVMPARQRRGIGRQLLAQAVQTAHHLGWRRLLAGPFPDTGPAAAFLEHAGAQAEQTYLLYQRDL